MPETAVDAWPGLECPCGHGVLETVHVYRAPPDGETPFRFATDYHRELARCSECGHFISRSALPLNELYSGDYMRTTYRDSGIAAAFARVNALPPGQSDNAGRVARVCEFAGTHFGASCGRTGRSVCDVGSGLCVFLHGMQARGWNCVAIDPDPHAAAHAERRVGVKSICSTFEELIRRSGHGQFDLVTFNKVLEHVEDPVDMLAASRSMLLPGAFVYIEVPDGEAAIDDGPHREEFFVEHLHAFSMASVVAMAARAGFRPMRVERLREPSSKYTLFAMLTPRRDRIASFA